MNYACGRTNPRLLILLTVNLLLAVDFNQWQTTALITIY